MLVIVVYHLHCSFAGPYSHDTGVFYLSNCNNNTEWCGEEWWAKFAS